MALQTTFPFENSSNYIFESDKIEVINGKAKLKVNHLNLQFRNDCDSDTGFIYNPDKIKFEDEKIKQKYLRPNNCLCGATFTNSKNLSFGNGNLNFIASNNATIFNGKLDLTGYSDKYIDYSAVDNANMVQKGCIRFKLTPNYNGYPSKFQAFILITNANGNSNNMISIYHSTNGALYLLFRDQNGNVITQPNLGNWNPTAGIEYEFELDFDLDAGHIYLFIDGILQNGVVSATGVRNSNIHLLRIGKALHNDDTSWSANFYIDDLIIFSEVQHTSNYQKGYTVPEADYQESIVEFPDFVHDGYPGNIVSLTNFYAADFDEVHYVINDKYWNGNQWVQSDLSYNQSNSFNVISQHIDELDVSGLTTIKLKAIFPNSNDQNMINYVTIDYIGEGYITDGAFIMTSSPIRTDDILLLAEVSAKPVDTEIKYIINVNGIDYYYDGNNWVQSDGSYNQSNFLVDLNEHISKLLTNPSDIRIKAILYSATGKNTPELDSITMDYDYAGANKEEVTICTVTGWITDLDNTIEDIQNVPIQVYLNKQAVKYKNNITIYNKPITVYPNQHGYFELKLIDNENMENNSYSYYIVKINNKKIYYISVPDAIGANFNNIIIS